MYDGNYGVVAVIYSWFGLEAPQVLAEKGWAMAALLVVVYLEIFWFSHGVVCCRPAGHLQ